MALRAAPPVEETCLVGGGPRLRVVVVDDQEPVRALLRTVLESGGDVQVVAEAQDGEEAIDLCEELRPGAVVCDLRMPAVSGDVVLRTLRQVLPDTIRLLCSAEPYLDPVDAGDAQVFVDKRNPDWPFVVRQRVLEEASRQGEPTWPHWERRQSERP